MWLDNRNAKLQRSLVFNTRRGGHIPRCLRSRWNRRRSRANKVRRVNLYLIAPFPLHLLQGHLGIFKEYGILNVSKAYGYAGRIRHCMRLDTNYVRRVCACCRPQD